MKTNLILFCQSKLTNKMKFEAQIYKNGEEAEEKYFK